MRFLQVFVLTWLVSICYGLDWQNDAIGAPAVVGSHTWVRDVLTVSGTGAGVNAGARNHIPGRDQCQYAFRQRAAGDFQISARLVSFTGSGSDSAGILVRSTGSDPTGAMAALSFTVNDNEIRWQTRLPAGAVTLDTHTRISGSMPLVHPLPLWIKLVRMGKNVAAYRSRDGRIWTTISAVSGGPIAFDGPLDLGFFSAGAGAVTATFDSIAIGDEAMPYATSWVGNTFGGRNDDNHVANGLSALWVSPDGTCYTSAYWDEGGTPIKKYKDGAVAGALPEIGTPKTNEGAITGDAGHVYVAHWEKGIAVIPHPSKPTDQLTYLVPTVSLFDQATDQSVISGLASSGHELFIADARANQIRVMTLDPLSLYYTIGAANDGVIIAPTPVVVPNAAPFAPALIYQTQRVGEGNAYSVPGLIVGAQYTLRCHFAEYLTRSAGRYQEIRIDEKPAINVGQEAGGLLKPLVKDFSYTINSTGKLRFTHGGYGPGLCGFEVIDALGNQVFAMNCGGPAVGNFKGESRDLVDRVFAFTRPGPMAVDARGDVWIIQRGNDYPNRGSLVPKYSASIRCHKADGTFTGRVITDVVNPLAISYDAARDQLIVGEHGGELNVRFYGALATSPAVARTFGQSIYSGAVPGLINDPAAGGKARFIGISGVGLDANNNLYVGSGIYGTDLRQFTADGNLGWMLNSVIFTNTYDVDPDSDGNDIYATYHHTKLDLTATEPGAEQTLVSYNWDSRRDPRPPRLGTSQSICRRLGTDRQLLMYTSGQGSVGDVYMYRYVGELAIPAGGTRNGGSILWVDANGDGIEDANERTPMPAAWITGLCVDTTGDMWLSIPSTGGSFVRHFFFKGLNAGGAPVYSSERGTGYEDIPFPEEGGRINSWGLNAFMDYDAERDLMVTFSPAVARTGEGDTSPRQYVRACYPQWSTGNRVSDWKVTGFTPQTHPQFFVAEKNLYPYADYMGMQIAGEYVFHVYIFGEVHVFDLKTGALVQILVPGPEVNGQGAWEDSSMGLRVFKRKNGEYLIFTENSGWGGKNNFFRWSPGVVTVAPGSSSLEAGQTRTLVATLRDQVGNPQATQPSFAWSVVSGGGSIDALGVYTASLVAGSATIRATAGGLSGDALIRITVASSGGNSSPIISGPNPRMLTINEDTSGAFTLSATDTDVGQTLTWRLLSAPGLGSINGFGSGVSRTWEYRPAENANGVDTVTVQVDDGHGGTDTVALSITINPVNDPPVCTELPRLVPRGNQDMRIFATTGAWNDQRDGNPDPVLYSYQWQRADSLSGDQARDIPEATGETYVMGEGDRSTCLRVIIVATDSGTPGIASAAAASAWQGPDGVGSTNGTFARDINQGPKGSCGAGGIGALLLVVTGWLSCCYVARQR